MALSGRRRSVHPEIRQLDGGAHRRVGDDDVVVPRQRGHARAQDLERLGRRQLAHGDLLEATLERRVAEDPSLVLLVGRGAEEAEFAARERRLEHVGRIHRRPVRAALPDEVVHLVHEEQHVAGSARLGDECAEALLVLAAIGGAGEQAHGVEREQPEVAHGDGHVALGDADGEPLGDGRLADAGRPHERRVVLPLAKEDVDGARDLLVAAPDDLEAPGAASAVRSP